MDNHQNSQNKNNFKNNLKETAGSAFHTVHSALQTSESVAMNTVDATANAVGKVTGASNKRDQQEEPRH